MQAPHAAARPNKHPLTLHPLNPHPNPLTSVSACRASPMAASTSRQRRRRAGGGAAAGSTSAA